MDGGARTRPSSQLGDAGAPYIGLGACIGVISGALSDSIPSRYWASQLVGVAAVGDLVSRVWWWRGDRR